MSNWLDLHTKVKAALVALGVIALGLVGAVANGDVSAREAVKGFVVAAVPVLVAYLKGDATDEGV